MTKEPPHRGSGGQRPPENLELAGARGNAAGLRVRCARPSTRGIPTCASAVRRARFACARQQDFEVPLPCRICDALGAPDLVLTLMHLLKAVNKPSSGACWQIAAGGATESALGGVPSSASSRRAS
jgi:hypothetical protein